MEYERIHKVQTGMISPSKLRLKLLGPHHQKGKEGGGSNSSRTSPSKLEDAEYAKSSLLAAQNSDFNEEGCAKESCVSSFHDVPNLEASAAKLASERVSDSNQGHKDFISKEIGDLGSVKIENTNKGFTHHVQFSTNLRSVHPMRSQDEDSTDYDSGHDNASSSSFEFHKGERTLHNPMVVRPYSRPVPSKWNDAEKWIMNPNASKKTILQNQVNRQAMANWTRVAPESTISEQRSSVPQLVDTKQIDSCHPSSHNGLEKFSFVGSHATSGPTKGTNGLVDQSHNGEGLSNIPGDQGEENQQEDTTTIPTVRSVSMRDTGTEMTPMTSQEPSRTGTPIGSTTPIRSPVSSLPSTPRGDPAPSPAVATTENELDHRDEQKKKELSEKELQLKTRREIVALGVQLGKMNIASWASKEEKENVDTSLETFDAVQLKKIEFEARAAAWEEAEKSKHTARYKREEIKIEAWESRQKEKIEAEMRRIEAQAELMRAHARDKMMNKLAITRQQSEEKRAAAEARKNRQAAKTAQQVEYIHRTGRIPSFHFLYCKCFP